MMRVLLISANTEKINMPTLPVGLGFVAAAARKAGHEVQFLDLMGKQSARAELERVAAAFKPQAIGISIRNVDDQVSDPPRFLLEQAREVVTACREAFAAPIILGGAGYSIFPQAALNFLQADMGIQGEGEAAFVELLERLENRRDLAGVPGLFLRRKGAQGARVFLQPLDAWPFPGPELFDAAVFDNPDYYLPFQTRRGCPLQCSYCSTAAIEGTLIRKRSVAAAVQSLTQWRQAGVKRVYFVDNTFNLPPEYARQLCEQIIQAQLGLTWRCILYPGRVEEPLVKAMAQAGCREASLGFESGSPCVLEGMRKRFSVADVRRAAALLGENGIRRMGFLLLGGPDETRQTVQESLAMVDTLGLEAVKLTIGIRIYPLTRLAEVARRQGVIAPGDDLLHPRFYITPGLEPWLRETVARWIADRPNWMM